jgi:hypothetical protein
MKHLREVSAKKALTALELPVRALSECDTVPRWVQESF